MVSTSNERSEMKDAIAPATVGVIGAASTFSVALLNQWLGAIIGVLTIVSLIPLVISRWKKYLKSQDTTPPFGEG